MCPHWSISPQLCALTSPQLCAPIGPSVMCPHQSSAACPHESSVACPHQSSVVCLHQSSVVCPHRSFSPQLRAFIGPSVLSCVPLSQSSVMCPHQSSVACPHWPFSPQLHALIGPSMCCGQLQEQGESRLSKTGSGQSRMIRVMFKTGRFAAVKPTLPVEQPLLGVNTSPLTFA